MSRLSEVSALYQKRCNEVEAKVKNGGDADKIAAYLEAINGTMNDISQTLAIIADEHIMNKQMNG